MARGRLGVMGSAATGGARVAQLRKARGISQAALARRAGISAGSLSKIEIGDRVLAPGIAAALAGALQMSLGALYGQAEISADQDMLLEDLRTAVRRYDIPDQAPVPELAQLRSELDHVITLRWQADLAGLLRTMPGLLPRAITYAHAAASAQGWALLAEVYSAVYHLAARHRWMDLVDIAPTYQDWAASRQGDSMVIALAARDRAGTFLHSGDFAGGLTVVDRAIATAQAALTGPEQAFATGTLHLRGITLAGWLGDRAEAQRHIHAAWNAAEAFPTDRQIDGHLFGPENTATHVLATEGDLGRPREVIRLAGELTSQRHRAAAHPACRGPYQHRPCPSGPGRPRRCASRPGTGMACRSAAGERSPDEPRSAPSPDLAAPTQQPPAHYPRRTGRPHRIVASKPWLAVPRQNPVSVTRGCSERGRLTAGSRSPGPDHDHEPTQSDQTDHADQPRIARPTAESAVDDV